MNQDEKTYERERMMRAMRKLGFPDEFGMIIADELGGPWSLARMTGYLENAKPTRPEDVADEMLAILEKRRTWSEKMQSESANAGWNEFLREE